MPSLQLVPDRLQMHLITPRSFNDMRTVADRLKHGEPVFVDLQEAGAHLSRRVVDFASGLAYALGGGVAEVSAGVLLVTPERVQVSAADGVDASPADLMVRVA
jgi:cell division inhibitor SepF